jgi:[acyl-carrier-protein] S-malonyltransferase
MEAALAEVELVAPRTPVVGNVKGQPMVSVNDVREELRSQVCQTVRWRQSVEMMFAAGVTSFVEIGPGTALTGLVRTTVSGPKPTLSNLNDAASIRRAR